ncbi:3-deoxy-D-manno-octulosonic acid kinase [Vibrio cholerae]|uniref:3-deoxy-D-manno-octulosonic acid kinase n=1 Tax=Vibrio TaxID=662 RepID=UPI00027348FA|nr:3-deoxy-D-manno-octulosonic acid kinase [Vibrio cholerae]MCO7017334.1 3-deoxy-D-manno-octulosonic acid kinase [Vibrio paracholerae]EGQ9417279.1 3-deoxy-D-manno-octulosonic acid kinase [Vibrio cholerae]EGR1113147.1 3-deoxy-D-manno-octulosonic acid kinase [Vibrio cholerae]EGR4231325.1 3-deoxy-D-manno-octulosonic acid kinase [Vibrio cholerae]EGR4261590.1 3-deoxy-D-manno-octulosonic acid kinase [Vibrio cholerae]
MIRQQQLNQDQMIWFDNHWISEPLDTLFEPTYWQTQGKVLGSAQGRGTTWFVQMNALSAALRHYRRGGLFGKLVSDHYFFQGWHKTRSYAEFHLLAHLRQQGVNVPRPIAARAIKCGLVYQADLLSEKIPNARDLVAVLQQTPLDEQHYFLIGQEIAKLHRAQVNHTDLNIHNILIDEQSKVWIIDFDKCHQQAGDDWKQANLQRLLRSFHKEQQRFAIQWQSSQWSHVLAGYEAEKN